MGFGIRANLNSLTLVQLNESFVGARICVSLRFLVIQVGFHKFSETIKNAPLSRSEKCAEDVDIY